MTKEVTFFYVRLIQIEDVKKEIYLTATRYWACHTGRWGSYLTAPSVEIILILCDL